MRRVANAWLDRAYTTVANAVRMEPPPGLVVASAPEVKTVLPYSYDICTYRNRSFEAREMVVLYKPVQERAPGAGRPPSNSYIEIMYPFASNPVLREQYQRFSSGAIRLGLMLEDLDTFAGDIAARHCGVADKVIFTGAVDRMAWLHHGSAGALDVSHDLMVAGEVTWVGKSSMEVLIQLSSRPSPPTQWRFVGEARFVMVARDKSMEQAAAVPPITPETPNEQLLFQMGAQGAEQRKARVRTSLAVQPPNEEETRFLHALAVGARAKPLAFDAASSSSSGGGGDGDGGSSGSSSSSVAMSATVLEDTQLMHSQDRNQYNRIFGGHLLRAAFELAFATAGLHAGAFCEALSMDDVAFLQPVPIGSILSLHSQVVYVAGHVLRVHVRAMCVTPGRGPAQRSNDFSFAFVSPHPLRNVHPQTIADALEYLQGRRLHLASLHQDGNGGARL